MILTNGEIIRKIERYGGRYDSTSDLSLEDQLLVCEAVVEAEDQRRYRAKNENALVNGNVNDTYKQNDKFELTETKLQLISKLNSCNYSTPINIIANFLQELFKECETRSGWWPYVAEKWSPKSINLALRKMTKLHGNKWETLQNPAAYFTQLLKYYKKRKIHRRQ